MEMYSFVEGVNVMVQFVTEYLPAWHGTIRQLETATKHNPTNVATCFLPEEETVLTATFFTSLEIEHFLSPTFGFRACANVFRLYWEKLTHTKLAIINSTTTSTVMMTKT